MSDTVTLPYFVLDANKTFMLSEEQRWKLVKKLLISESHTLDEVPTAWADNPLQVWCWLVLVVNGIDFDDDDQKPLIHYGIDLGFSQTPVRTWIWAIS